MVRCLLGQLSPQQLSCTTLLFIQFESNLKWLSNVQLSIGAVVARAVVAWAVVPRIGGSFVAS